jgi:imidazolonepropionase-like amidohydrolase
VHRVRWAIVLFAALAAAASGQDARPAGARAIVADGYVDPAGKLVPGRVRIQCEAGKIVRLEALGVETAGAPESGVDQYSQAIACPGLIDCAATLAVRGGLAELQSPFQPQLAAAEAFNRFSPQLRAALAAGVTAFALSPDDQNLVGGRIAICQTAGAKGRPEILTSAGPLKLSLSSAAFKVDREPTSRSGALGLLREKLDAARVSKDANDPLAAFANGKLTGILTAPAAPDVLTALDLVRDYKLRLVLLHEQDARRVAELTQGQLAGVIVGPLGLTAPQREAEAARLFAERGVPVAIAGGLPWNSPDGLRVGAAIAARAGLKADAARRAITAAPAELLDAGDQIGALKPGGRADVVVFSGDPLDLRSRVLAVYIGGERVYVAEATASGASQ